ncbi:hypothetical protein VTP01DRAFT_1652 [Rhizomucor pusillus]|uniref:uncharacterized protein n=1 Tax=Rhizomucor pusillus TaxID=4840 RepID=UPI0037420D7B
MHFQDRYPFFHHGTRRTPLRPYQVTCKCHSMSASSPITNVYPYRPFTTWTLVVNIVLSLVNHDSSQPRESEARCGSRLFQTIRHSLLDLTLKLSSANPISLSLKNAN